MSRKRNWPPFSADNAACPKCDGTQVNASWQPTGAFLPRVPVFQRDEGDWIQRHCTRCHYEWPEEPKDAS